MKTYALSITLCFLVCFTSPGKIKNGYSTDIHGARESLRSINLLLATDKNLSIFQRFSMKGKINDLTKFITYYELTEKLLNQFRTVTPDLYFEIDTLTDRKGRNLDVYIKFVPEKEMTPGVAGTTNLNQDKNDPDAYFSEYGINTVSVRIAVVKKALPLLAHELGHVRYQAPNLADYMQFYTKFYLANTYKFKSIGHNDNDPSGHQATVYSKRFREKYLSFIKYGEKKIESHVALLQEIQMQFQ
ncbi:MAG: hypothetical protein WD824_04015 [Cyclobacteriaceae bacterium]